MIRPLGLSPRLRKIADIVPLNARVADIGTDHARIPVFLVERGITEFVTASDIAAGPLESAMTTIAAHRLSEKISLRQCSGAAGFDSGEIDAAIIAGMGGDTIVEILAESPWLLEKFLILQPMTKQERLIEWLNEEKVKIANIHSVAEGRRTYTILQIGEI